MRIGFVTDPLDRLDAGADTSIGLMLAAQERGAEVWTAQTHQLEAVQGRARAHAQRIRLTAGRPWYSVQEQTDVWLDELAAIFMRTEPPLDPAYVTATLVLDGVDRSRTAMVNDPSGLRACSEHLLPLQFPDLIPPTVVTASPPTIVSFVQEHKLAVVKPVDGFAGRGVYLLGHDDPNLRSLIETSTQSGMRAVVVQAFLPEVADGNKRIFVLDGEPVGAVYRFPADGDFRIGNPSAEAPLTARDREICGRLRPRLRRNGIRMAGLDVIGPHLIEVNVTSPGALRKADLLLGWSLCAQTLERVLWRNT